MPERITTSLRMPARSPISPLSNLAMEAFRRGLPSVAMLTRDLVACGIEPVNEQGRVDFHTLRHTFVSILANVGVSELIRVKLARHSEWRQTDRYTDPASLPLFSEMEKFASVPPSSIPSPKTGKTRQNSGKAAQTQNRNVVVAVDFRGEKPVLAKAVPSSESVGVVPEGGLEPPRG